MKAAPNSTSSFWRSDSDSFDSGSLDASAQEQEQASFGEAEQQVGESLVSEAEQQQVDSDTMLDEHFSQSARQEQAADVNAGCNITARARNKRVTVRAVENCFFMSISNSTCQNGEFKCESARMPLCGKYEASWFG